jgi:hypothetical protein
MPKIFLAFLLSVLSFFLMFLFGETALHYFGDAGLIPAFMIIAAYFFICQFLLSRGHSEALRQDWPIMLALNAVPLLMVFGVVLAQTWPVIFSQGLGILLSCCGGTFAGALAASRAARRAKARG